MSYELDRQNGNLTYRLRTPNQFGREWLHGRGLWRHRYPVTYQEKASFTQIGGAFVLDLLSNAALGKGFDSALFQISLNSVVIDSQSFTDLASAKAFFSDHLISHCLLISTVFKLRLVKR